MRQKRNTEQKPLKLKCIDSHWSDKNKAWFDTYRYDKSISQSDWARFEETTDILLKVSQDEEVLLALAFVFLLEVGMLTLENIADMEQKVSVDLCQGVLQLDALDHIQPQAMARKNQHQESLRKMLLSLSKDIRSVFIKLSKQLYWMRHLSDLPIERRQITAKRTRDLFAPLANRLGIWRLKWELEDLTFRFLEPENYQTLAKKLNSKRNEREAYITAVIIALEAVLAQNHIRAQVSGRSKHIYSIHKKMQQKNLNFSQLFDLRAVRILAETSADCYAVLGVVHHLWTPIPHEFDDYISNPKPNNYRSLHTAVRAIDNQALEVQIRTQEMHDFAESGVAAHWRYKEKTKFDSQFENKIKWLRQLLNWQKDTTEQQDFELAEDFIYVLSPQGEVVELPKGATPLDFAYYIHTDLGHRTRGAKVDGRIASLTEALTTMSQVEILTSKESHPSKDWMDASKGYLHSASARSAVKRWFRQQGYDDNVQVGQAIFHKEAKRLRVQPEIDKLIKRFNKKNHNDLMAAIGIGDISIAQLIAAFEVRLKPKITTPHLQKKSKNQTSGITIDGVNGLLTSIAQCCHPVPGDEILGYISKAKGVVVHRFGCPDILHLSDKNPDRVVDIGWSNSEQTHYAANILIKAYVRDNLLKDLTLLFASEKINLENLNSHVDKTNQTNHISVGFAVKDVTQLTAVLNKIEQIRNVYSVTRV